MAGRTAAASRGAAALLVAVCLDLSLCYAAGLVETRSPLGHLARAWAHAALRCSALTAVALLFLGHLDPVLTRVVAAHGLLPAVFETGSHALYGEDSARGSSLDARRWLTCAAASLAAALFWEVIVRVTVRDTEGDAVTVRERKQKARVLLVRVLRMFRPEYPLLLGGLAMLTMAASCEMFIPFYTGRVIDIVAARYRPDEFFSALLLLGLFSLGSSLGAGGRGGVLMCAISSFTCRMKIKLFEALTRQDIGFFETTKTGEITSRLSRDTPLVGRAVCLNVNVLLRTSVMTLGALGLMAGLSWRLSLLVLMEAPIIVLIQNLHDTRNQRLSLAVQDSTARAADVVNEVVSGIRAVRSFNTEKHEARRYDDRLMDTHVLKARQSSLKAVYLLARRLTGLAMKVIMLYYSRLLIQSGQMTTGNLVSFLLYQSDLGDNFRTLTFIFGDMLNSVGAAGKVFEYLDRKPEVCMEGTLKPDQLTGHVIFHKLNFAYPTSPNKAVLQDFSLELKAGQMTALVGRSGEGKSTCVSLLQRFYEQQHGDVLLDGRPLASYDHRFLHQKVAVVSQEPELFSGSIRDNIAYGLAECSLEEIQEAARKADAHDFIMRLEEGYDAEVGEGGGHLTKSGRQQIALARALVRQPRVLILDEVTSSLDTDSEKKILQTLAGCPTQTRLLVSHKLKNVEAADQIAVMEDGRIRERGTHRELMQLQGSYYKLWSDTR
ncbi:antigen peptide transporter 2a [Pseudoliparis swirei]|uniref:antigen peptide transporter 2a n=1 Tax=Pseudoliparis swirei TaxID=2059687 RepID=UPI0024BD94A2|nr:antigen peptide transporter 2a [Pseudoliparis swirei]